MILLTAPFLEASMVMYILDCLAGGAIVRSIIESSSIELRKISVSTAISTEDKKKTIKDNNKLITNKDY